MLQALLSGGTTLARTASAFLAKNQKNLVRFINGSAVLLDAVHDNRRAGITDSIAINIALGTTLPEADLHRLLAGAGFAGSKLGYAVLWAAVVGSFVWVTYPNYDSYYALVWGREALNGQLITRHIREQPTVRGRAKRFVRSPVVSARSES